MLSSQAFQPGTQAVSAAGSAGGHPYPTVALVATVGFRKSVRQSRIFFRSWPLESSGSQVDPGRCCAWFQVYPIGHITAFQRDRVYSYYDPTPTVATTLHRVTPPISSVGFSQPGR